MAFWGRSFIFNDIPCEDYDLMLYDAGNSEQGESKFASGVSVIEETLPTKYRPLFYGVKQEKKLEFPIVFGVNQKRVERKKFLDRYELETIAFWLTGHDRYMWLEIEQDDLEYIRYRCVITELEVVEFGKIPWALKATVVCDSPYAYLYPQTFEYDISGSEVIDFYNESSHNGYFMPQVEIELANGGSFSIINQSDNNREFLFKDVPASVKKIAVDNDHCIITNDQEINVYPYFNFHFLRLDKGLNQLRVTGNGKLRITCEFPVNVGG